MVKIWGQHCQLYRFELGLIDIPDGSDPLAFFLGQAGKERRRETVRTEIKSVTVKRAWKVFQDTLPNDALEQSTLSVWHANPRRPSFVRIKGVTE